MRLPVNLFDINGDHSSHCLLKLMCVIYGTMVLYETMFRCGETSGDEIVPSYTDVCHMLSNDR